VDEKLLKFTVNPAVQGRQRAPRGKKTGGRPEKYNPAFVQVLRVIWELFDFQCGKLLSPLIKGMMEFLVPEFTISEELQVLLKSVSPRNHRPQTQERKRAVSGEGHTYHQAGQPLEKPNSGAGLF